MDKKDGIDPDFLWGKFPPQESSFQFTRSMMEMRKPKPYELKELPRLKASTEDHDFECHEIDVADCPYVRHSIKLLRYIREVQDLLSRLNTRNFKATSIHFNQTPSDLLSPPAFETLDEISSIPRRSRSTSSSKSIDTEEPDEKAVFSAPKDASDFRCGTKEAKFPNMSDQTASRILKRSVATVAAHVGFDESQSSALNVLTGLTENFLVTFSRSLRHAADAEAETGTTAFYDCLDQALHESGCSSLQDIKTFWQDKVLKRHQNLKKKASELSKSLKSFQYPKEEPRKISKVERSPGFSATYGKWTPVTGMSSTPFPTSRNADHTWGIKIGKSEPADNGMPPPSAYNIAGPSQFDTVRPKNEFTGFEFSTRSPSIELLNADRSMAQIDDQLTFDDQQGLYEEQKPLKKKPRIM